MGLFSFTEEQYAAYKSRQPTDPASGAAAALGRIEAALHGKALVLVRRMGPHRALVTTANEGWMMREAVADVALNLTGYSSRSAAPFGVRVVVDAWIMTNVEARLRKIRLALRDQYATRASCINPQRDKAAEEAMQTYRALELADAAHESQD